MSIESYINAMPKAEIGVQLEGAAPKQTLLMLAEVNDIPLHSKANKEILKLLDTPNYDKLPDLIKLVSQWVRHPDDLSRLVYDVGVALSKQNIRYAEIGINPLLYMNSGTFEQFAEALNDGRDKALRGWNIHIQWILNIPRDEPRRGDDVVRYVTSAAARKYGVVGLGLSGTEDTQPAGQFERAFKAAEKKGTPRVIHAGDKQGATSITDSLDLLEPTRIIGAWGAAESPELMKRIAAAGVALDLAPAREYRTGRIEQYSDYPLRELLKNNVPVTLSSHMPALYRTTLSDDYLETAEQLELSISELEEIALNAVRYSLLQEDDKNALLSQFRTEYAALRAEHLPDGE